MDILNARFMPAVSAYLAVSYGHDGRLMPWAVGDTPADAIEAGMRQAAGVSPTLQAHYADRLRTLPLTAEQAAAWRAWFTAPESERGSQPGTAT
jgi:hypothetical protein